MTFDSVSIATTGSQCRDSVEPIIVHCMLCGARSGAKRVESYSVLAFLILKERKNGKMLVTFCWEILLQNNRDTVESAEGEKCNLCFICLRI